MRHGLRWTRLAPLLLVLLTAFGVAACSSNVKTEASEAKAAQKYDLTIKSYKSGQFLLDGAVLSSLDLSSHFGYLKEAHKLPKTVFLEPSDKYKIRKDHMRYLASMAYTYGFKAYYEHKHKVMQIVATGVTKLKDSPAPNRSPQSDGMEGRDASQGNPGNPGGY